MYVRLESEWAWIADMIRQIVNDAPKAKEYFSNGREVYASLQYHLGQY